MKKILEMFCFLFLFVSLVYCQEAKQPLQLIIKLDKDVYELEERMNISYELTNTSNETQRIIAYGGDIGFPCETKALLTKPKPIENEDYIIIKLKPGEVLKNSCEVELVNETFYHDKTNYSLELYGWEVDLKTTSPGQYDFTAIYKLDNLIVSSNTITFKVEKNHVTAGEAIDIAQREAKINVNKDDYYIKSIEDRQRDDGTKAWFITFDLEKKLQQKPQGLPITQGGEILISVDKKSGEVSRK